MVVQRKPLVEITQDAIKILSRELGPVDTMRFIGQFTVGYGDYTAERDAMFADMTLDDMIAAIKHKREQASTQPQHPAGS